MAHTALRERCRDAVRSGRGSVYPARTPGQALAELAFVLPLVLFMMLGIVEFGRAYVAGIAIEGAAREGARLASTLTMPGGDGTCGYSTAATTWCNAVWTRVQQSAQPEVLNSGTTDTDITICAVTVAPPAVPAACPATGNDRVPNLSGQAVTVTTHTFHLFYLSFLTKNSFRWLGFGTGMIGIPIQASSTMRVP